MGDSWTRAKGSNVSHDDMTRNEFRNERRPEQFDALLAEFGQRLPVSEPVDQSDGEVIAGSPESLRGFCVRHGQRPSMRHQVNRKVLGAGDSTFAKFIGDTTMGESEEAHSVAATMVHPELASVSVTLVSGFGLALEPGRSRPGVRISDAHSQHFTKRRTTSK